MKKDQRAQHELDALKKQYPGIKKQVMEAKRKKLWHYEAVVRNRLKDLSTLSPNGLLEYRQVYNDYVSLLGEISAQLLQQYNETHGTAYRFEEIVRGNFKAYVKSGILSVLVTDHIPKLVAEEYNCLLPENPKDEYPMARAMKRKFFLHLGETNTGKTYRALQCLKQRENGVYLAPLRILALENYERLNRENVPCSLMTGEEEIIVEGANHASCTVEKADLSSFYEIAVIDEVQMVSDSQRGDAWTRAILGLRSPEIHLCGALHGKEQLVRMIQDCGDAWELIEYARLVPLQTQREPVKFSEIQRGDALVAFSKRRVLSLSRYLSQRGIPNSVIYGDLPPEVRRLQYDAFIRGENPVLVSTDAIGMGVNLPIRRIIFTEIQKFDGMEFRLLSSQEIKQIAGRAGRIGIYDVGYVATTGGEIDFIENQLQARDEEVEQAVVGPSEVILQIGGLPLKEKLALWSTREESLAHYRKKDVGDYLLILDRLKPYKLREETAWRLMMLPFDVHSDALMEQFLGYVEERFVQKLGELTKPCLDAYTLPAYEEYYQRVDLYYAFSKGLNLPLDEPWVYETRQAVSHEISGLLQQKPVWREEKRRFGAF